MQLNQSNWIAFILVLLLIVPSLGIAAGGPWYEFEIIIFERINPGAGSTEYWPTDPGTPSQINAIPMRLYPPKGDDIGAVAYKTLPRSVWRLTELEQRLRRSKNFRPQIHLAWRQQMWHPNNAQPLLLEMMDRPDARNRIDHQPKIEGTVKIGIQRFLHFDVDLLIRRQGYTGGDGLGSSIRTYRMQSNRRMRSGKLYYLDHPVMGVLVLASRYSAPKPKPAPAPVETATPELGQPPQPATQ